VLSAPSRAEEELLSGAVERGAQAVLTLVVDGPEKVMNEVNRKEPPSPSVMSPS
jgi:peptidyl-tRNA hydrolase